METIMKNKAKGEKAREKQLVVRLPDEVFERIDAHAARLKALAPGLSISRTEALRSLVISALDAAEGRPATRLDEN